MAALDAAHAAQLGDVVSEMGQVAERHDDVEARAAALRLQADGLLTGRRVLEMRRPDLAAEHEQARLRLRRAVRELAPPAWTAAVEWLDWWDRQIGEPGRPGFSHRPAAGRAAALVRQVRDLLEAAALAEDADAASAAVRREHDTRLREAAREASLPTPPTGPWEPLKGARIVGDDGTPRRMW